MSRDESVLLLVGAGSVRSTALGVVDFRCTLLADEFGPLCQGSKVAFLTSAFIARVVFTSVLVRVVVSRKSKYSTLSGGAGVSCWLARGVWSQA